MRTRIIVVATACLIAGGGSASAQVLSLEFQNGRVRLVAENVPVSRILGEWTRVGGTTIVHGERVPGGPVTLQLTDVPERQALDIVLRGAAGYMVAGRQAPAQGRSVFDKILVLPTTARAPSAAALPPPQTPPQPPDGPDEEAVPEGQRPPVGVPPALPRGRVPQPGPAPQRPLPDDGPDVEDDSPTTSAPSNPFGVRPGTTRPGVIVPPPRTRDDQQP
jgi:hypothetical protein